MSDITKNTSFDVDVEAAYVPQIYGAVWAGGTSSAWVRTDLAANFPDPDPYVADGQHPGSSPFDNIMPWSGMVKETISGLGTLVKIPKYWYKWTRSGTTMMLQISPEPQEGFYVSPAHADRDDGVGERDFVYVGRYHCSSSNYQSASGVKPNKNITRATARSEIHNLNTNAWQLDFAMFWTVNMLCLVEFADWDSQVKIGYGCGNGATEENSGKTDSMPYHTGTMQTSRTTYGTGIQYRYIEDWWANVSDFVDGIYFGGTSKSEVYIINKPSSFSDSSGGTNVGTRPTSSGYIKTWTNPTVNGLQWALYPASVNSGTGYVKDYCEYGSSGVTLHFGGSFGQSDSYGALYLNGYSSASGLAMGYGCRLMYLPGGQPVTSIPVTVTGTGSSADYIRKPDGTWIKGATSFEINVGDVLGLHVSAQLIMSSTLNGRVIIDDVEVMSTSNYFSGQTYDWTVPAVNSIDINIYSSDITVTTT